MMNILLAHGSSDSRHAVQAKGLAEQASAELGDAIELRFLNSESLPAGAKVLPLLLGEGWHAKKDLKRLAEASDCIMLSPLSGHPVPVACMAADLASEALQGDCSAVFALYHLEGFEALGRALEGLGARFERLAVVEMYGSSNVAGQLTQWQGEGVANLVLQPMALFEGRTMEHVRRSVNESGVEAAIGPALTGHAAFPAFIADCFREA